MKTNLQTTDFLLWREPGKTSFQFFLLGPASGDGAAQIWLAPFFGEALAFSVLQQMEVEKSDLPLFEFPEPENELLLETTDKNAHVKLVTDAVAELHKSDFSKVVLSRTKRVACKLGIAGWLGALADAYPQNCVFLFGTKASGMWMGATPEVLLQKHQNTVAANSLAGTRLATESGNWGEKEIEEQAIVTKSITETFAAFGVKNIKTNGPKTKTSGPVAHLFTEVSGQIAANNKAIDLAKKLHPTPAVGGLPQQKAIAFIRERENYNRQFYTGFFGVEENENARFYVNLRSMQLFKNGVVLYAGGGITASSNPEAEWEETERKLQTLVNIII